MISVSVHRVVILNFEFKLMLVIVAYEYLKISVCTLTRGYFSENALRKLESMRWDTKFCVYCWSVFYFCINGAEKYLLHR